MKATTGIRNRELVCNADIDFYPARPILSEIFRCLELCDVFVAVVSTRYCNSRFCRYEIEHAHLLELPIILIFIEHVHVDDMNLVTKEVFETFTRVQFEMNNDGECKITPDWTKICESIIQLIMPKVGRAYCFRLVCLCVCLCVCVCVWCVCVCVCVCVNF